MLGSACIRLCVLGRAAAVAASVFSKSSQSRSAQRLYSGSIVSRQLMSPALPQAIHGSSVFARGKSITLGAGKESCLLSSFTRSKKHSSSCLLAANGVVVATIWHALLPSRHVSSVSLNSLSPDEKNPRVSVPLVAAGRQDGSWNVALDARPARWLHGRHSAWLLFGVCSSLASAGAFGALALAEAVAGDDDLAFLEAEGEDEPVASHGKPILKEYTVTGIPGDGRCLFRAVAYGACLRQGKTAPNESTQRLLADELRDKVVDELILRRSETEWFIEGDFDNYTQRMRKRHVWGGEPELLMLSHILKQCIELCGHGEAYPRCIPLHLVDPMCRALLGPPHRGHCQVSMGRRGGVHDMIHCAICHKAALCVEHVQKYCALGDSEAI